MKRLIYEWRHADGVLAVLTVLALGYGFVLIGSMQRAGDYNYLRPQLLAAATGGAAALLLAGADYRLLIAKWRIAAVIAVLLTAAVFLFGMRVDGTDDTAWISLPWGLTVQPSEFVKVCFIITLARHLAYLHEARLTDKPLPAATLLLHTALPVGVLHIQGDDGAALIFGAVFLMMAAIGGVGRRRFAALGGAAAAGLPLTWFFVMNDAQRSRLLALFGTEDGTITDYGWQQYQGKLSVASGGLFGTGLFRGPRVAAGIVPEQENDFIFTVAGEELGFLGCAALMALLFGILLRVLSAVRHADCYEGRLICGGVFAVLASQTVINLGMVLGVLPVVGVTLPLFSAGGSSLIGTLLCLGLVQSVRTHREPSIRLAGVRKRAAITGL